MLREGREPLAGAKEEYSFYLKLGAGTLGARPESPCLTGSQELGQRQVTDPQRGITKRKSNVQSQRSHEPKDRSCPSLGQKWHRATQNRLGVSCGERGP